MLKRRLKHTQTELTLFILHKPIKQSLFPHQPHLDHFHVQHLLPYRLIQIIKKHQHFPKHKDEQHRLINQ
jgi:hypothetical protein